MIFEDFQLLRPLWLLLLPVLGWLLWQLAQRGDSSSLWQKICDPALLPFVLDDGSQSRKFWLPIAGTVSLLGIVALAGPSWERLPSPAAPDDRARVFVLDLSASMAAADLSPDRLTRAKFKLQDLLQANRQGRNGLIVFAGGAWTVSPLTEDINTIINQLPALSIDLAPVPGADLPAAINRAANLLQQANARSGDIILLTDSAANDEALKVAANTASQGFPVSVLGVGSRAGAPIPAAEGYLRDASGAVVNASLPADNLAGLAAAGGGRYLAMRADNQDVTALAPEQLQLNLLTADSDTTAAGDEWRDAGIWLLWLMLPFAALAFRRGWLLSLPIQLTLFMALSSSPETLWAEPAEGSAPTSATAETTTAETQPGWWDRLWKNSRQLGWEALNKGQPEAAAQWFESASDLGAARYRNGDYQAAASEYANLDTASAHYNRGNALAQSGKLDEALAAYDEALKRETDFPDAEHNRALVEKLLEEQSQQNQDSEQEQSDNSDQQQSDQEQQDSQQSSEDSESQSSEQSEQQQGDSREQDSDQQSESDQAEVQDEENSENGEPQTAEEQQREAERQAELQAMLEQAEKEQAAQQWLRRVPDDPAGLLRRKFQLQQRQHEQAHGNRQRDQEQLAW